MNGVIQLPLLGSVEYGRFGNQLSQYIFAKVYAESISAELQTPKWIGQQLFQNIDDPPISGKLPRLAMDELPNGQTDVAIHGFFQSEAAWSTWTKADAKRIYQWKPEILNGFTKPHDPMVVAHLRRGDLCYPKSQWQVIVKHSFEKAIEANGYDLSKVIWISDKRQCRLVGMDLVPDFLSMIMADVLFCSNLSTFSTWGSILGNARTFVGWARILAPSEITPRTKYVEAEFKETVIK